MYESYVRYAQIMGMVHLDTVRLPIATHSDRYLEFFSWINQSNIYFNQLATCPITTLLQIMKKLISLNLAKVISIEVYRFVLQQTHFLDLKIL